MATIKAGDVRQITINGREFDPKGGDGKVSLDVGGFTNKADPTGNGGVSVTQNRKLAGFKDLEVYIDDDKKDLEFLQELANKGTPVPCVVTMATGKAYSGSLAIVGDVVKDYGSGTCTVELRGAKLEQI